MTDIRLDVLDGEVICRFQYDSILVGVVKSLSTSDRRWDAQKKAWVIAPEALTELIEKVQAATGKILQPPLIQAQKNETTILTVHYLGRCKDRNGEPSAFALLADGEWGAIFPESALRTWFEAEEMRPNMQSNLFSILDVKKTASLDEIKAGYRKMAKLWHPDICSNDPDGTEQFMRIQKAWEVLSDDLSRERYLVGLMMEATLSSAKPDTQYQVQQGYRAPLRCGLVMVEGRKKAGRFVVITILGWQDIYNAEGLMMTSSWSVENNQAVIQWV